MPRYRIEGRRAVLECAVVPAPAIRVMRRPVIERIVIDISVIGIEAVIAGIGAAVAPVIAVPSGPDMALANDRSEIRRYRRHRGADESRRENCSRNKKTFHNVA